MENVVEFALRLKDMMSGGMAKVAAAGQSSFSSIEHAVDKAQRKMDGLGRSAQETGRRIAGVSREAENLERTVRRAESSGSRSGGLLSILGSTRGMAATAGIAALGTVFSSGMQAQAQKTGFEVLAGQAKGGALYSDITKFAQDSIFGNELYKNAQSMLVGGTGVDEIMPRLKMLGDISMGSAEKLGSLTVAYSQNQAAGRLMGQELNQFINAGWNPLYEIAVMTGKSMGELRVKMEQGAISADMVTSALQHATSEGGKFYNMTNKIADTTYGKWEALKGQAQGVVREMAGNMEPALSKLLDTGSHLLTALAPPLSTVAHILTTVLNPALKVAGGLLDTALHIIEPVIKGIDWVLTGIFGAVESKGITDTFSDSGEEHGKVYVSALAREVHKTPTVIDHTISDNKIAEAWKKAGQEHAKTYEQALMENMETWDLTAKVKLEISPQLTGSGGLSDFMVDEDGNLKRWYPGKQEPESNPYNAQHVAAFNKYFKTGDYRPKALSTPRLAPGFGDLPAATPAPAFTPMLRYGAEEWQKQNPDATAGHVLNSWIADQYKKTPEAPAGGSGKMDFSSLDQTKSKGITGGGVRSIVFHIDTVGVKGGMTVQAATVQEGLEDLRYLVQEEFGRMLDSVGGAIAD